MFGMPVSVVQVVGSVLAGWALLALLRFWAGVNRKRRLSAGIPSLRERPVIGCILEVLCKPQEQLNFWSDFFRRCGRTIRVFVFHEMVVAVSEPEDLKLVLTSAAFAEKPKWYATLWPTLGKGSLTSSGERWRRMKRAYLPALHPQAVEVSVGVSAVFARGLRENLRSMVETGNCVMDVTMVVWKPMLITVCKNVLGVDVADDLHLAKFMVYVRDTADLTAYRLNRPWLLIDQLFWFTKKYSQYQRSGQGILDYAQQLIDNRKQEHSAGKMPAEGARHGLVDGALTGSCGVKLTDIELRDEISTQLLAGSVTTSEIFGFILMMLAFEPSAQQRLLEEIDDVLGADWSRGSVVTMEHISQLEYMERVIHETLRLFPLVPLFGRETTDDFKLVCGSILPRGSLVGTYLWRIHRDPEIYPDPLRFDPDRFLPAAVQARSRFTYLPFATGPRGCPGRLYAIITLKVFLATLLREFRILPPLDAVGKSWQDVQIKYKAVLYVEEGIQLRFALRDRDAAPAPAVFRTIPNGGVALTQVTQ